MSTNSEVAEAFRAIADLLELRSEKFKPEAYRRAARSIEGLGEDLRAIASRGGLDEIPGVGDALREKILEFLHDGRIPYYERLKAEFPPGVLDLMRIPGIGPKTTGRFFAELHVDSPAALLAAIDAGRLSGLSGFGDRKIEKLRQALVQVQGGSPTRTPLRVAWELARSITRALSERTPVRSIDVAGSLRRRRETVGDLDILATSSDPPATIGVFVRLKDVEEVVLHGDTKATVRYAPGVQVDLRVVDPESFGAALQYFTGSKEHNVRLRTLARERGLKINEYGVFRGEERIAGRTEEEVYGTLGLPWIPPELRENQGEFEAAGLGTLPKLVELAEVKGELHRHVDESTTPEELAALLQAAQHLGLGYVGVVLRHPELALPRAGPLAAVRSLQHSPTTGGPRLLLGLEVPLGALGVGDPPDGVDYLIGVLDRTSEGPPRTALSHDPLFLAHVALPSVGGKGSEERFGAWRSWSHEAGVALEVTPDGPADGIDSGGIRRLVGAGDAVVLSGGDGTLSDLSGLELAVGLARRGGARASDVLNVNSPFPAASRPAGSRPRAGARKG